MKTKTGGRRSETCGSIVKRQQPKERFHERPSQRQIRSNASSTYDLPWRCFPRSADGKFNGAMHPHLGQAGAPYAKTVPSKTHPLGALPDPGDLFDHLMAREEKGGRQSPSGLSSMLIYHATIIIHDIFGRMKRTRTSPTAPPTLIYLLSTATPWKCSARSGTTSSSSAFLSPTHSLKIGF